MCARVLIFFLVLLVCMPSAFASLVGQELNIAVDNKQRRAVLVKGMPSREGSQLPVIIVLHGGMGSADRVRRTTGFDRLAMRNRVLVVYAEGTPYRRNFHAWNTGYLLRGKVGGANDVKYLDKLIDVLIKDHGVDPMRIYMTGISNGAMMTFVYAIKRSERLAAIAPVVGAMFSHREKPRFPIPILMINGALDNEVPIEGGMSRNSLVSDAQQVPYLSLESTVRYWVEANRSTENPHVQVNGSVRTSTYPPLELGGAITISILDKEGGHGWPGSPSLRPGNTPISFEACDIIWDFLKDKQRSLDNPVYSRYP